MYEFAGSKSAKLVVQKIREISSPSYSVYCLPYSCVEVCIINLHTELSVCCLLQYINFLFYCIIW
jgi:hypothetical protein